METVTHYVQGFMQSVLKTISGVSLKDALDILLMTTVIYYLLILLQRSNAYRILKGVLVLLAVAWAAQMLKLNMLGYFMGVATQVGLFALVVLFQPELRKMLEQMGSTSLSVRGRDLTVMDTAIPQTVMACSDMAKDRVGALIVFARKVQMTDHLKTGTEIDAAVSAELMKNIFYPKAPLHDGAVIVVDGRIAGAGCVLPLTQNPNISRELGTRHKAAIGMSENSDAVVVIVSEETGVMSVAVGGMLKRHLAPDTLEKLLRNELTEPEEQEVKKGLAKVIGRFRVNKHE